MSADLRHKDMGAPSRRTAANLASKPRPVSAQRPQPRISGGVGGIHMRHEPMARFGKIIALWRL
jgi:hypothetical protein